MITMLSLDALAIAPVSTTTVLELTSLVWLGAGLLGFWARRRQK